MSHPFSTVLPALLLASAAQAAFPPDQIEYFEKQIRPLLAEHCYECHGEKRHENGLRLDRQETAMRGSDYGKVILPGNVAASKLLKAVRHEAGVEAMPKKGDKLSPGDIGQLEKWIAMGAPWPEDKPLATAGHAKPDPKKHWAYLPVVKPAAKNMDELVDAKLAAAGLKRAPQADDATLCRRIHFAITGMPPSVETQQAFAKDTSPDKVAKLVDHLLASLRYGERWGRIWLDVARYSDTEGYQTAGRDIRYPYAYTYRDWVVKALNEDMPYDKFLSYQLAADRIVTAPNSPDLAAMGFLTVGDTFIGSRDLQADDRIDVITRGMLGLSVGCARCHDHKYDPIPSKDYYSLYSIFSSSEIPEELPVIGISPDIAAAADYEKKMAVVTEKINSFRRDIYTEIRKPENIQANLTFVYEANHGNWTDEEFRGKAGQGKIRDRVARAWSKYLQASKDNPVITAWTQFAAISAKDFPARGPELTAKLTAPDSKVNAVIRNELAKRSPMKSIQDVAKIYADAMLSAVNGTEPNNGAWNQMREVLGRGANPLAIPVDGVDTFFTRKDAEALVKLRNEAKKIDIESAGAPPRAMVMRDRDRMEDVSVFIRGNPARRGEPAPRGNLTILGGQKFTDGSGRLELARVIASNENPLTARVIVNRIWLVLFGAPLVNQTSDFGVQTAKPEQAALLDYLAANLMENGWSLKKLQRQILTSGTFCQSSQSTPEKDLKDADYALLSRFKRQRLDYESMRDAINTVANTVDTSKVGGRAIPLTAAEADQRRTIYHVVDRYEQATVPAMFDFANPDSHSPQRYNTTVPQQSLFLMNSPYMKRQAENIVTSIGQSAGEAAVTAIYRRVLQRDPKPVELQRASAFLKDADQIANEPRAFSWRYGFGPVTDGKLASFTPMAHYTAARKMWTPGEKMPMEPWGHLLIQPNGGHPGRNAAAVLQWTVPFDHAKLRLSGDLKRTSDQGNGIRGMIISSRTGVINDTIVKPNGTAAMKADIEVQRGDVISFVVDCIDGNTNNDGYNWSPRIDRVGDDGKLDMVTKTDSDFCDATGWPFNRSKPQSALAQLAQVLIMSNEFMFVD